MVCILPYTIYRATHDINSSLLHSLKNPGTILAAWSVILLFDKLNKGIKPIIQPLKQGLVVENVSVNTSHLLQQK